MAKKRKRKKKFHRREKRLSKKIQAATAIKSTSEVAERKIKDEVYFFKKDVLKSIIITVLIIITIFLISIYH